MNELKVIELFAGVGGFRLGLEGANKDFFKIVWSNQWEPSTKTQHASRTYARVFGDDNHSNEDICKVNVSDIPNHDMLVGGFPCQDYSVATTLSNSKGIEGKKGVLWWEIYRILSEKGADAPSVLLLENVDRLIQSPAKQRGRDFAIILKSLSDLGYVVEWRIINAADYGMPQRRKRTYILAYKKGSHILNGYADQYSWAIKDGVFATTFPIEIPQTYFTRNLCESSDNDLVWVTNNFNKEGKDGQFMSAGVLYDNTYITFKAVPKYDGNRQTLGDIVLSEKDGSLRETITENYYISKDDISRWEYVKGSKRIPKVNKYGFEYIYSEGGMTYPDPLDKPSRTIITSENTKSPNRFTHVIKDPVNGRLRRLVPIELERLNMFPDNHTIGETDTKRSFFMGNALVVGIVERLGKTIYQRLSNED